MKRKPWKAMFWTGFIYLAAVCAFAVFLWPIYGLAALGILLLITAICFILKRSWWETVKPKRKKKDDPEKRKREQKETVMVLEDCESGETYPIQKSPFVIGRQQGCDMVVRAGSVSRTHCQILFSKETNHYYIEDLNSTYGTFVGVRQLPKKTRTLLKNGDMISVSDIRFIFKRENG